MEALDRTVVNGDAVTTILGNAVLIQSVYGHAVLGGRVVDGAALAKRTIHGDAVPFTANQRRELRNALALLGAANADAAVEALGDASDDIPGCEAHRGYPESACRECVGSLA